ncbi:MAG: metal-sulfur cluster assembly factor [Anaerolineae bacterium]|nr:metal-sulfur cluster assembly factor [Anaerolineae bacterium]MDW8071374.1 metal-sulfur cluster assembly factor [Anaerolineae bacterium]
MSEEPAQETTAALEQKIRAALRSVVDPELHLDVIALGLIREIDTSASPILLKMVLTTPFCPFAPWMVRQVHEVAERAAGVPVKVEVLQQQWHPEMMEDPSLLGF